MYIPHLILALVLAAATGTAITVSGNDTDRIPTSTFIENHNVKPADCSPWEEDTRAADLTFTDGWACIYNPTEGMLLLRKENDALRQTHLSPTEARSL